MDTKWNIVEFNKKYEELKNQVSQEMKVVENNLGVALNPSILQNLQVDTTQKVNIVFVGQYSAGKSSIIKMLPMMLTFKSGLGLRRSPIHLMNGRTWKSSTPRGFKRDCEKIMMPLQIRRSAKPIYWSLLRHLVP